MTLKPTRRGLFPLAGAALGLGLGSLAARREVSADPLLRPPGALDESHFLAACIRCGQCVEACPHDVLYLTGLDTGLESGTPAVGKYTTESVAGSDDLYEDAAAEMAARPAPCWLCPGQDQLLCIPACPTDALQPIEEESEIRMGVVVIDRDRCLSWVGTACRSCWHACPFPNEALKLDWKTRPEVFAEACIGCAICSFVCPTEPTSIRIVPQAAYEDGMPLHIGEGGGGL
jgi:ferredoxin-type protein NapG